MQTSKHDVLTFAHDWLCHFLMLDCIHIVKDKPVFELLSKEDALARGIHFVITAIICSC